MIYEFQATQSFNGYTEPWAPGAGKNKYDPDTVTENNKFIKWADGTTTGNSNYIASDYIDIESFIGEKICLTPAIPVAAAAPGYALYTSEKEYISGSKNYEGIEIPATASFLRFSIIKDSASEIMLEVGEERTAWEPYTNLCMPEGFNIWDPENAEYVQIYAGYVNSNTRELLLRPVYEEYAGEELVGPWMSSLDPYDEDTTPTNGAFVIDFGGELTSFEITPYMLQTLLDSLGIRQHFLDGASLLNSLMDQAQGRVRSEEELLLLSRPLKVIAIGDQLPAGLKFKPISKDVLPGLPGKFIR